jgi:hypothetical protein
VLASTAVALAGGLVAGLVVVASPGNATRTLFFQTPPLLLAVVEALWYPSVVCFNLLVHAPVYLVTAYAIPWYAARGTQAGAHGPASSTLLKMRRLIMLAGAAIIAGSGAPAFYVGGAAPPPRGQIIPQFVLLATITCCGLLDGFANRRAPARHTHPWQPRALAAAAAVLLVLGPVLSVLHVLQDSAEMRAYAMDLDSIDHTAREVAKAGRGDVVAEPPRHPSLVTTDDIGPDPSEFPNTCVADYYGLESIAAPRSG